MKGFLSKFFGSLTIANSSQAEIGDTGRPESKDKLSVVPNPEPVKQETPVTEMKSSVEVAYTATTPKVLTASARESDFTKDGIIRGVVKVEGGYVNNPKDSGGETNFGITAATANKTKTKAMLKAMGWNGKMIDLTEDMAVAIYDVEYWTAINLDAIFKVSPFLADKLFDQGVNCGTNRAGKWLQRALNAFNRGQKDYKDLVVDGGIGGLTLTALDGLVKKRGRVPAVTVLLRALIGLQSTHYIETGELAEKNEEFMFGWFNERLPHNVKMYFDGLSKK